MKKSPHSTRLTLATFLLTALAACPMTHADEGLAETRNAPAAPTQASSSNVQKQFAAVETVPLPAAAPQNVSAPVANRNASGIDFPKVQSEQDAKLAHKFVWWPTDSKPAPFKDPDRSGYWWWPDQPGQQRPWGNQGYIYVRKIIFDYKSEAGEGAKPSLIIKRVIKNVKVYFDYDQSNLRDDAVSALDRALDTLEHNPKADILITGNADVRGSEQYNEKLGERRATTVRRFLQDKGLSGDRIRILSRGKLDAMAPTNDLEGMQRDRNAQFMIAEVEEVMIPASQAHLYEDKVIEEKKVLEGEIRVDTRDYVVQKGDTLWSIAKKEYGDGRQWKRLYEFNKSVISNPDRPKSGTRIKIPIENNA